MSQTSSVVMWVERGLVASMLIDLDHAAAAGSWELFLRSCCAGGDTALSADIRGVWCVVEPDFSNQGFGHPDAVLRIDREGGSSRAVIVEAKRLPYAQSCQPPAVRGGAGYNSSLNGQLELNHCLALAVSEFGESQRELRQPGWILHSPYGSDRRGRLRCLKNPAVIEELAKPLSGISFRDITHLVITTDVSDPFEDTANEPLWPELYHPEFPFQNCWKQFRAQFAWTSWAKIEDLFRKMEADAVLRESLFLGSFSKNRRSFKAGTGSPWSSEGPGEPPPEEVAVPVLAHGLSVPAPQRRPFPGNRGARGASMIYAPGVNPSTFVHFSWLSESCAIRDYSRSPNIMPLEDRSMRTSEVVAGIAREAVIRNRRPISDTRYWHETTLEVNKAELPPSNQRHRASNSDLVRKGS